MFNADKVKECLKGILGWKDHYDLTEIPTLPTDLKTSESGEFYNESHPAMKLNLIKATLPSNRNLEDYLKDVEDASIIELLNEVSTKKDIAKQGKTLLANDVIYNSKGFLKNTIINESRFVGVRFTPLLNIGLKAVINRVALQLNKLNTSLDIYLYHSSKVEPLTVFKMPSNLNKLGEFIWHQLDYELIADDKELSGGSYYIGYFQDSLNGEAIRYENLNWKTGYCGSCDGGVNQSRYTNISRYVKMQAFYIPSVQVGSLSNIAESLIEVDNNNFGFNFNISVLCDLTNFYCDNRLVLKNAIKLKVIHKILKDISYSQEINHIEEQLKSMIIRDLEGDKETNYINIVQQYKNALKAVNFNQSGINHICLPCIDKANVSYGTV